MPGIFGDQNIYGMIIWFIFFFVMMFYYPKLYVNKIMWGLEKTASKLEEMDKKNKKKVLKSISANYSKDLEKSVDRFRELFVVTPASLDPIGIVQKIEQMFKLMHNKFELFVDEICPNMDDSRKKNINYGLRADMSVHQITKIVRHYVELVKKFNNLQLAMMLEMQLPMIIKIIESEVNTTDAFLNNHPIGDSIGPLVSASLINSDSKLIKIGNDIVYTEQNIQGNKCFIVKANGPEPELGEIGTIKALNTILRKNKIKRIISIDAATKLEGEKSGSIAEGIGFVIKGGFHQEMIEDLVIPKKIPIDGILVKMSIEECGEPMRKEIKNAIPDVIKSIEKLVKETNGNVLIFGVGNTCGVGNNNKDAKKSIEIINELDKKRKEQEKKKAKESKPFLHFNK